MRIGRNKGRRKSCGWEWMNDERLRLSSCLGTMNFKEMWLITLLIWIVAEFATHLIKVIFFFVEERGLQATHATNKVDLIRSWIKFLLCLFFSCYILTMGIIHMETLTHFEFIYVSKNIVKLNLILFISMCTFQKNIIFAIFSYTRLKIYLIFEIVSWKLWKNKREKREGLHITVYGRGRVVNCYLGQKSEVPLILEIRNVINKLRDKQRVT